MIYENEKRRPAKNIALFRQAGQRRTTRFAGGFGEVADGAKKPKIGV